MEHRSTRFTYANNSEAATWVRAAPSESSEVSGTLPWSVEQSTGRVAGVIGERSMGYGGGRQR